MNLENQKVIHKAFGEGTIIAHKGNYITVSFQVGKKEFAFPDAFNGFLTVKDAAILEQINAALKEKEAQELRTQQEDEQRRELEQQKSRSLTSSSGTHKGTTYPRANIAFKCTFCDGGQSADQVGFDGVCSDKRIHNNIDVEHRTWCNAEGCACLQYRNNKISRKDLDLFYADGGIVCYESRMLRDWKAKAGIVQNGENKGKPMKLNQVRANSLCVLTTRDPQSKEEERYIFAVFLVDETYKGDGSEEGYVSTKSPYKIKLSPEEAHSLLFWNYHANDNKPETAAWNSGLHRYFEDEQAAQILRDIAKIKTGTADELLATDFYAYFCNINAVDASAVGEPHGALQLRNKQNNKEDGIPK